HGPPGRISDDNINNEIHLALQLFDQSDNYLDLDTCHQFVMMADLVMRSLHSSWLDNESLMGTLLQKMSEAVDISLKKGYWNCGCNHDLPWISSLLPKYVSASHQFAHFSLQTVEDLPARPLWSLINILEKGLLAEGPNNQGQLLFTGKNIHTDFIELKEQVEKFHPRPCTLDGQLPPTSKDAGTGNNIIYSQSYSEEACSSVQCVPSAEEAVYWAKPCFFPGQLLWSLDLW
ncbi:hypothetical protein PHLCEN_2v1483, partial [Hermanssonia centrifuga]